MAHGKSIPFRLISFLVTLSHASLASAYFEVNTHSVRSMNEIAFDDHKDFPKTWHLVTSRYRQESREMRFVYANAAAYAALDSLDPKFPDGAIFAKIGTDTSNDPSFSSSVMPVSVSRVQFMVKNAKKYKDSDGWGYALFDSRGIVFPEDIKTQTAACVACHRLVPERDFVFSRKFDFGGFTKSAAGPAKTPAMTFKSLKRPAFPALLAQNIPGSFVAMETLTGPLSENGFSGTLDEIQPLLKDHAERMRLPAALILNEKSFSAVIPLRQSAKSNCGKTQTPFKSLIYFNGKPVRDHDHCVPN